MKSITKYAESFNAYLTRKCNNQAPSSLFDPIDYILNLGGKRIRPALVLMTTDLFDGHVDHAYSAAMAIEVFHNFSLVHDDIMDDAPLRRQHPTVHEKWDINTAILSGDSMLIWAYQCLEDYDQHSFYTLVQLFSKTAQEVCSGQQMDMDFENLEEVSIEKYLEMIRLKTAVLVACAFKMGSIIAGTSLENQDHIYSFGINLGIAFQIQDDLLDVYGNPKTFGKQVGGDIIENKKTFLYLKALELSSEDDRNQLKHLFSINPKNTQAKIETVKQIYDQYEIKSISSERIERYKQKALLSLNQLNLPDDKKQKLKNFAQELMHREA
ncbi:polyprenyl synthetase family protein [Mesohalobacter halotolerans]|uniref:Polyprenyl synthetase family protein n=1 Tax=Mesohalobacter halotolerans TaxID=1883405 RepID=A0A4U5TSW8_9FLAO|nr:polyprenyl synthetase family protein [Mesohalobacter halotolerans]MBS3737809.1 polyprenyl synthetase family protein [Psychroflexus sp.]TKS57213.1 polyprenyl synthetase family protein [Mesohalobacter halotolerans]